MLAYGSCIARKTPVFAINLLNQRGHLNTTICANDHGKSVRQPNIRRAQTSSDALPQEQRPVTRSTAVRLYESSVVHNDRAGHQNTPADYSERNAMDLFFRPTSANSSDSEDCISLSDFVLNEE
ncbi:unnamed protein product [Schistocephalus solidus]|uniref:Uncharacterized protein n=1 Tax=Schistocephalus solidus TaxID=70667 RepID=A0A183S877_SCHSO|nr:unnamed protein product [Schistocephalus solidus]